ncbi:hypothetical protein [Streptomyces purpurascens]|uniref:hypothetical protein n=1 Tax=Streptomyces purpurascens TaxID=1924 RepID=UPI001673198C|nr:hypothetical protein [Streptomyces purpurascens]MCE7050251.1 hypothetical protein [Streptomyces purpurascens]GHA57182.1 hypothetical protein GCM10010303_81250 [Streptomyces purpurascens]
MTQSLAPAAAPTSAPGPSGLSRPRRVLRAVAVLSCLPYLGLKAAWIAGSHVGIPEGSALLDDRVGMAVINGLSVLLDSAVIVLALVLTRPWGLKVPAWLLAFPVWVATGLLAPIMTGFPAQLVVKAFDGGRTSSPGREAFLYEWVFTVVYTGFILQGIALGALFVLYARDRWGHLWRGRVWELPVGVVGPAHRALAVAAAVLALLPLTVHLLWACGVTAGLSEGRAADRTAGFHVLEAVYVMFLVAAVAGGFLLAFRRGRALPVAVPLGLAWVGSGAVACWGGWLALASLGGVEDLADRPTPLMSLAYAGQMLVGFLVAAIGVYYFAERSARAARRAA